MLKRFTLLMTVCAIAGCSEPEPQVIDIEDVAAEAGMSEDEFTVDENGIMTISAKNDESSEDKKSDNISNDQPLITQGDDWQYIANNGIRTADEYAVKNNSAATYIGNDVQTNLVKQYGGEYEGGYLLTVINDNEGSVSYAQLQPLFDIDSDPSTLDDESKLWQVTTAKYNGQEF